MQTGCNRAQKFDWKRKFGLLANCQHTQFDDGHGSRAPNAVTDSRLLVSVPTQHTLNSLHAILLGSHPTVSMSIFGYAIAHSRDRAWLFGRMPVEIRNTRQ
jgi:hypothetical protein